MGVRVVIIVTSTGAEVAGTEVATVGTNVEVLRMGNEDVVIADEYAKQGGASQQVVDQG